MNLPHQTEELFLSSTHLYLPTTRPTQRQQPTRPNRQHQQQQQQQQHSTNEDVEIRIGHQMGLAGIRRRRGRRRTIRSRGRVEIIVDELESNTTTEKKRIKKREAQRLFYMPSSVWWWYLLVLAATQLLSAEFICCRPPHLPLTSLEPEPTAGAGAESAGGGEKVREFVRSSAATTKNLDLLARLESTLQTKDYQLFYPQLLVSHPQDPPSPGPQPPPQPRRRQRRQTNLRQSSVVQSNWLQQQQQQQSSSSNQGAASAIATTTTTTTSSSGANNKPQQSKANQALGHYNKTNVVIQAFNYKLRLDLELNNNLFGPGLIQKHILPKGGQQISTQKLELCYYHASTQAGVRPSTIGAFRTCSGLSGIIHVNDNESFVIQPLFDADLSKKHPHIIYRYQSGFNDQQQEQQQQQQRIVRQCGNSRLHQWALRTQYNSISNSNYNNNNTVISIADGANKLPQRQRYVRDNTSTTNSNPQNRDDDEKNQTAGSNSSLEVESSQSNDCDIVSQQTNNKSCETITRTSTSKKSTSKKSTSKKSTSKKENEKEKSSKFARDISLTEKYIELALILSQDMFDKRNTSSRLDVLHDSIQIINCLDLYFRYSANTRVALIYLETWAFGDQIDLSSSNDAKQILYNFLEYTTRKLYKVSPDAAHLLTGGHARHFDSNEMGMSMPDSICSTRAVSVSQETSIFEPFIAASTIAHMLGHNLGMEHDDDVAVAAAAATSASAGDHQHRDGISETESPVSAMAFSAGSELFKDLLQSSPVVDHLAGRPTNSPRVGGTHPLSASAAKHSAEEQGEDHEDEIKGRSLAGYTHSMHDDMIAQQQYADEDPTSAGSRLVVEQADQWCSSNCLMSKTFTYNQPPVTFGNMIQQQIATEPATNGSIFAMFSGDNRDSSGGGGGGDYLTGRPQFSQTTASHQHLPFRFSRKSIDTYHGLLRAGRGVCLFNKPNQLEDFKTCGNGIVDRGEDCDCGTFQECFESGDTCCDPVTCRFKADAECINGACCDRCKLRPRGLVCRRARGECDLAEVCDGKSGQCAPDVYKQNGQPCANNTGFCYLGQCPTHDGQCTELWGQEARKSHKYCYSTFNSNGTIRGNCGHESNGGSKKYKRCEQDNVMCGTIQCQMGDMKPITASAQETPGPVPQQAEYSKKTLHSLDGVSHECKAITGPTGSSLQVSYVRDGSKCGANRVCLNQTCQPVEKVYQDSFELCPRDEKGHQCSGNGICSTAHRCHCEPGWLGHDCSQKTTPTSFIVDVGSSVQTTLDQVKPSLTLLEPINVTEMPTRRLTGTTIPQLTTATISPEILNTGSTVVVVTTTQAPTITTLASSTPAPAPVVGPSTVVLDKKKHDALGAPTLVFILVSIVAAVYVGFALMANCYRRKGFIKPDKVLRHHQMNCKLDALRSSFIARRLADATMAGSFDQSGSTSLMHPGPMMPNDPSILSPNLFSQAPSSAQFAMQEAAPMQSSYDNVPGPQQRGFLPSAFKRYPFSGLRNTQPLNASKLPMQTAAQVHYFDNEPHYQPYNQNLGAAYQQQQQHQYPGDPPNGSCDHIPLLMPSTSGHQHQHQHQQVPQMSSFNSHQRPAPIGYQSNRQQSSMQQTRGRSVSRQASRSEMANINRATSLGNVNGRQQDTNKWHNIDLDDNEEQARSRYQQKALATPVRHRNDYRHRNAAPPLGRDDSFSATSSPEHGYGVADWTEDDFARVPAASSYGNNSNSLARQQSNPRLLQPMRARQNTGYHEDLLMGNLNRNDDDDSDDLPLTFPPPPSKSISSRLMGGEPDGRGQADDLMTTEDESTELSTVIQRQPHQKRQSEPELLKKSPIWLRQRVEKIPLNNMGQDEDNDHEEDDELPAGDEQLSLLAQLQQLEQVQSLHQRQVANHKPANEAGTLHEFFSLPLSVQLSALLARSLNAPSDQPMAWQTTPIDEYLNTLNSSSVAAMSRRSFRDKQPPAGVPPGSRGGTLNRQQQQMKLQNLQSLINRLQKLHQHQQRQHHHIEDDFQTESVCEPHSRQSTLGRRSASRTNRHLATADDSGGSTNRRRTPRRTISRKSPDNRNESVFSMSDSEDGATYTTRALRPNAQQARKPSELNAPPNQERQLLDRESNGPDTNKHSSETPSAGSETITMDPNPNQQLPNGSGNLANQENTQQSNVAKENEKNGDNQS